MFKLLLTIIVGLTSINIALQRKHTIGKEKV